jgi:S-DNA-T family DNA segregation ATPase FtsK/SpoIIIE
MPVVQPPGRAVLCSAAAEVQLAAPPLGPALELDDDHVNERGTEPVTEPGPAPGPAPDPRLRPLRVEPLPELVFLPDLVHSQANGHTDDAVGPTPSQRRTVTVGVGGDELDVIGLDLHRDGPLWLVAGSSRSGKSTALCTIGEGLGRLGHELAVVSSRPGPLDALRSHPAVSVWAGVDDTDALVTACRTNPDLVVLVDDADQLLDTPVEPVLRELARAARQGRGLVACSASTATLLTQYRGVAVEVARSQVGLLLCPRGSSDGELFGLPAGRWYAGAGRNRLPGRGLLVTAEGTVDAQVAVPEAGIRSSADRRYPQPA